MPTKKNQQTGKYIHPEASLLLRPEVGAQAQFKKKKPPASYRYDSSLSPALDWDAQNPAREQGELHIRGIQDAFAASRGRLKSAIDTLREGGQDEFAKELETLLNGEHADGETAATALKAISKPFLDWAGKAEHLSFEVPTLPLFVHERLSTQAILETIKGHKADRQMDMFDLFGERDMPLHEKLLKAYEYANGWTNRMILGDSLVVMNSLLHFESMAGQVQMIYMDPPYGVKFGSNFQPFVRKRDVKHNDDGNMTREPEMVKAYRDTWELGLHSYLTYMRDRLLLSRELLVPSGSIFVQISDENLHHVREVMDEVFGEENFCGLISFRTTGGQSSSLLSTSTDFLVWYGKSNETVGSKFKNPTTTKSGLRPDETQYNYVEPMDGSSDPRPMTKAERSGQVEIDEDLRVLAHDTLYYQGAPSNPDDVQFTWRERTFKCPPNTHWKPGVISGGMQKLASANRLMLVGNTLRYKRYLNDFPVYQIDNVWDDTARSEFARKKNTWLKRVQKSLSAAS